MRNPFKAIRKYTILPNAEPAKIIHKFGFIELAT
jgi:hypothetical protein